MAALKKLRLIRRERENLYGHAVKKGVKPKVLTPDSHLLSFDAGRERKPECEQYTTCLSICASRGWRDFSCADCDAFKPRVDRAEHFIGRTASLFVLHSA